MLEAERSRVRVSMRSLIFCQFTYSFQPHYDPGADTTSSINEYQKASMTCYGDSFTFTYYMYQ
jgi:hypothetical protein